MDCLRVSPPTGGTVSLCRCVIPAGCSSCTRSVCHRDAPPGFRKSADRSVRCRSGQITVTPSSPGTWGTWGCDISSASVNFDFTR